MNGQKHLLKASNWLVKAKLALGNSKKELDSSQNALVNLKKELWKAKLALGNSKKELWKAKLALGSKRPNQGLKFLFWAMPRRKWLTS